MGDTKTKKSAQNYLWKISTDERFQAWPEGSSQIYLTSPTKFFPKQFLKPSGVRVPDKPMSEILGRFDIEAAAFTTHKKGFYISRSRENHYILSFVISGRNHPRTAEKTYDVKNGMLFLIPPNTPCDTSAPKEDLEALWFHIKNTPRWRKILGSEFALRKAESFSEIIFLAKLFAKELYEKNPSALRLQSAANLLVETIAAEFSKGGASSAAETLAADVLARLDADWTLAKACKKSGMGRRELTDAFVSRYGATFSKFLLAARMEEAARLLERGATLRETAAKTGFSDGRSLALAYKNFHGLAPKSNRNLRAKKSSPDARKPPITLHHEE